MNNSTKLRRAKKLLTTSNGGELFLFKSQQERHALVLAFETVGSYRSSSNVQWASEELEMLF
jgi:hypothetical protein